jgi:hypothetical protein
MPAAKALFRPGTEAGRFFPLAGDTPGTVQPLQRSPQRADMDAKQRGDIGPRFPGI